MNENVLARRLKLGILVASLSRNAAGVHTSSSNLAAAVSGYGVEVTAFGVEDQHTKDDAADWRSVEIRSAAAAGPAQYGFSTELLRSVMAADLDLLHLHGLWMYPSVVALWWARRTLRPHVVSPHGMLQPWALCGVSWRKRLAQLLYEDKQLRRAACLHALTADEAQAFRDYGLKNAICVIPNGVEVPPVSNSQWISRTRCDSRGRRVLLYLGRLHPSKGIVQMLEAWSVVRPDVKAGWVLTIAGWGQSEFEAVVREKVVALSIQGGVEVVGPLYGREKVDVLQRARGFILPSLSEGLPTSILEAWAYGIPVLMTRQCNLDHGVKCGAALEIGHGVLDIAHGIECLMKKSESELDGMGQAGRDLVTSRYSWATVAEEFAGVYRWLAHEADPPKCVIAAD